MDEGETGAEVNMKVVKVDEFKYFGSTTQSNRVHKRGEEDSPGRVEWAETDVRGDL